MMHPPAYREFRLIIEAEVFEFSHLNKMSIITTLPRIDVIRVSKGIS